MENSLLITGKQVDNLYLHPYLKDAKKNLNSFLLALITGCKSLKMHKILGKQLPNCPNNIHEVVNLVIEY